MAKDALVLAFFPVVFIWRSYLLLLIPTGGVDKKCYNHKLGILEFQEGVSTFHKYLNYKLLPDSIQKRKIKTFNLPIFNVNLPFNMMSVKGWLPPLICSQIQKCLNFI